MEDFTINVIAGEDISCGDAIVFGERTWKERLFTRPWRPLQKLKVSKPLQGVLRDIAQIPGVISIRVFEND